MEYLAFTTGTIHTYVTTSNILAMEGLLSMAFWIGCSGAVLQTLIFGRRNGA